MKTTIIEDLKSKGIMNVLTDLWQNHWQLIIFLVLISVGINIIFRLAKTALYIIKARIIYHYVGILVMAAIPLIEDFLNKQNIHVTIPTIAGINLSTIVIGLLTLNLTRIISKQVSRRF